MSGEEEATKPGPTYVNPSKRYGLILAPKANSGSSLAKPAVKKPVVKPCIFDDEDDNDDDNAANVQVNTNVNRLRKETQLELEKALIQDPKVFEYDEIYDELEAQKAKQDPKNKTQNQSKEVSSPLNSNLNCSNLKFIFLAKIYCRYNEERCQA